MWVTITASTDAVAVTVVIVKCKKCGAGVRMDWIFRSDSAIKINSVNRY